MHRSLGSIVPFAIAVSVFLSGCATTQQLSEQDRKRVEVVKLNDQVKRPKEMYYFGPGASIGFAFGAIGGAIAAASQIGPGQEMLAYAEQNGVRIEEIVAQEFGEALKQSGKFRISDTAEANGATISLSVFQFGFSVPNGFSSKLVPVIAYSGEMADASGNVLWRATENLMPLGNPVDGIPADELRTNPKAIETAWRAAAKHIAARMVEAL